MNIFTKIYKILLQPSVFFNLVKNEKIENSIFYLLMLTIIQAVAYYYSNISFNIFLAILIFLGSIGISTLLITFFIKIYKDVNLKQVLKNIIYSLTPIYIISTIILLVPEAMEFIVNDKPVFLLLTILFSATLFHRGIVEETKIKGGMATAAIIFFSLFLYIIKLGKIDVILFYAFMMGVLYYKRKKFTAQGAVLLYKTKLGLKLMESISKKYPRILKVLGEMGIWLGFLFMAFIIYILIDNAIKLVLVPSTIPGVSPVLPGIPIPGAPIFLPLWYGILSIFITVLIHEFSHGVIARLYKIKVKSSGILFMGPILGAFVEPDEKVMEKKPKRQQLAVLGAGPFSNVLLAGIIILILNFAIAPLMMNITQADGASINVIDNTSAQIAGLESNMIITQVDGIDVLTSEEFYDQLNNTKPNQELKLTNSNNQNFTATLSEHPEKEGTGYLGVTSITNYIFNKELEDKFGWSLDLISILQKFLTWLFIISFGIGIANLIPLGPVDGGRMLLVVLMHFYPDKKAKDIWNKVSIGAILLLAFVLFFPLFKWIFGQF